MAVPDPDALYFQYFGGGGVGQIAPELTIDDSDWETVVEDDVYLWSYANRRTFWSFGDTDDTLKLLENISNPARIIAEPLWTLSEGRSAIILDWDLEICQLVVSVYDDAGVLLDATTISSTGSRTQGTYTFTAAAIATAGEGYITIKLEASDSVIAAEIHGLKLQERRIAQADLP